MKKILAVVGSPRKRGNTDLLVGKMAEGAVSKGAKVDTLYLGKLSIRECDGCHVCWKGKSCNKHDDMLEIYAKIAESDAFIFGTPVYWYGPTALMKAFIDRFVYFNCPENRAKIRGKSAALAIPFEETIVGAGSSNGKSAALAIPFEEENPETARPVVEFFEKSLKYLELKLVGAIIAGGAGDKGDILRKPGKLAEAGLLGEKLANAI